MLRAQPFYIRTFTYEVTGCSGTLAKRTLIWAIRLCQRHVSSKACLDTFTKLQVKHFHRAVLSVCLLRSSSTVVHNHESSRTRDLKTCIPVLHHLLKKAPIGTQGNVNLRADLDEVCIYRCAAYRCGMAQGEWIVKGFSDKRQGRRGLEPLSQLVCQPSKLCVVFFDWHFSVIFWVRLWPSCMAFG